MAKVTIYDNIIDKEIKTTLKTSSIIDEVVKLYREYGNDKYMIDEPITQTQHVITAATIGKILGVPDHVIIALLFHDIGQLILQKTYISSIEILHKTHAEIGYEWLKSKGFHSHICELVRYHDLAKIIICMEDTEYFHTLSLASKESLVIQYENYTGVRRDEFLDFLDNPRLREFLSMRKLDDISKYVNYNAAKDPIFFYDFEGLLQKVLSNDIENMNTNWMYKVDDFYNDIYKKSIKGEKFNIVNSDITT